MDPGQDDDYPHWHNNPFLLTTAEIEDPYLVLEEFFSCYSLTNLRGEIWYMLTSIFENSKCVERPGSIIFLFRQLERLAEAALVLHRTKQNKFMSTNNLDLNNIGLKLAEITAIDMVICYGIRTAQEELWSCFDTYYQQHGQIEEAIDLLILSYGKLSEEKISAIISLTGIKAVINIQKAETVYNLIKYGNFFFSTIIKSGKLLFSRRRDHDIIGNADPVLNISQQASRMVQADLFFKGANFYFNETDYNFTAFMCHQAVEQALLCLVENATGFKAQTHNLHRLIELTLNFTPEIWNLTMEQTDKQTISHLIRSYSEVRFNDRFSTKKIKQKILLLIQKICFR